MALDLDQKGIDAETAIKALTELRMKTSRRNTRSQMELEVGE